MRIFAAQVFVGGLMSAAAWTVLGGAQQVNSSSPPVLKPRITVVGKVSDSTADGAFLPNAAAVSPNGTLIVYVTRGDLRVITAESAAPRVIFDGTVHTLFWGDKGDALTLTYDDPRTRSRDIYVLHVDPNTGMPTGPAVKAADGPVNHGAKLSPDESLVAYARPVWDSTRNEWSDTRADLAVAPANGGPIRTLVAAQDLRVGGWSPDGRTLYFHGFPDPSSKKDEVRSISVDGGTPTSLGDVVELVWPNHTDPVTRRITAIFDVPQGISITDWSSRNPIAGVRLTRPRGVRIISLDDGSTRDLTGLDAEVGIPDWFAGGTKLAFIERRDDTLSLVTMNADGSSRRAYPFTTPPRFEGVGSSNAQLQVSPDGNYAAFLGESRETLELLDLRAGAQRRLVKVQADASAPEGVGLGQLLWNADSKSIQYIYGLWAPPRRAVREVTLAGVDRLVLPVPDPTGVAPISVAAFPANTVASPKRGAQVVELFDLQHLAVAPYSGGAPRTIYKGQIRNSGSLSPDGRTFAIRDVNGQPQHQVTLVSVDDGSSRVLTHPFIQVPGIAWHPDGKRLLIMGRDVPDGPVSLYSVPVDGTAPRAIATVGSNRNESVIVLSPDGSRVAATVAGTPTATFLRLDYDVPAKSSRR